MTNSVLKALTPEDLATGRIRMLPGNCIIDLDPQPERVGSIVVPDSARDRKVTDTCSTGVLVACGYGEFWRNEGSKVKRYPGVTAEELPLGTRVIVRTALEELEQGRIMTDVRRIDGKIEE